MTASETGYVKGATLSTLITRVDAERLLDRLVDAIVKPVGGLLPVN